MRWLTDQVALSSILSSVNLSRSALPLSVCVCVCTHAGGHGAAAALRGVCVSVG